MTYFLALTLVAFTAHAIPVDNPRPTSPQTRTASQRPAKTPTKAQQQKAQQQSKKAQQEAKAAEEKARIAQVLAVQVTLDRAGFSTGVVDGKSGQNTERATEAFRSQQHRDPEPATEPLVSYQVTEEDAAGPYEPNIPSDLMEQSKLTALSYRSPLEALAERFHTTPEFLKATNPKATFAAGDTLMVPNVEPLAMPEPAPKTTEPRPTGTSGRANAAKPASSSEPDPNAVTVTVSRAAGALTVKRADGQIVFYAPVTTGSDHDPLPIGEWKVNGVQYKPTFYYNPALFWDADASHSKVKIPPGPNGPVGLAWIDISKEHYGLHGSPEPSQIGHTQSHGCVRLTNWDVLRLATLVKPGTPVLFTE